MTPHQPLKSAQEDSIEKRIVQLQLNKGTVEELLRSKSVKRHKWNIMPGLENMLGHSSLNFSYYLKIHYICHNYTSYVSCNIYIFTLITLDKLLEFLIWLNIRKMYMKCQIIFSNYNIIHVIYIFIWEGDRYREKQENDRKRDYKGWQIQNLWNWKPVEGHQARGLSLTQERLRLLLYSGLQWMKHYPPYRVQPPLPRPLIEGCCLLLNFVQLLVTPWNLARKAPLSVGFSRQRYWSGFPFPYPGDFPHPVIQLASPAF